MKNIHLIPTDKPSRLYSSYGMLEDLSYGKTFTVVSEEIAKINLHKDLKEYQVKLIEANWKSENIYITSDEEIKEGDWCIMTNDYGDNYLVRVISLKCIGGKEIRVLLSLNNQENTTLKKNCKKIILTTDPDLIKDGVQAIDDEFLEWFVNNQSCEFVEVIPLRKSSGYYDEKDVWHWDLLAYKIIIPEEESKQCCDSGIINDFCINTLKCKHAQESKQETLEEVAKDYIENTMRFSFNSLETKTQANRLLKCAEFGAKWQQERSYSKEEVKNIIIEYQHYLTIDTNVDVDKWFEQLKKINYEIRNKKT